MLRSRYSDRSRFIITRGRVRMGYQYRDSQDQIYGRISGISVGQVNVPLPQRKQLEMLISKTKSTSYKRPQPPSPRYRVQLAYGKRYEPWVISIEGLTTESREQGAG